MGVGGGTRLGFLGFDMGFRGWGRESEDLEVRAAQDYHCHQCAANN